MPKLILKRKAEVLQEYPLKVATSAFTIGSEPGNDLVVPDKLVSMTHFQIERQDNQYFVRDLKSAFGTYVNGTRINLVAEIHDGDVIQVGEHSIVFKTLEGEDSLSEKEASSVGQSFSEFLSDVKEAVINAVDGDTATRQPRDKTVPPLADAAPDFVELHQASGSNEHPKTEIHDHDSLPDLDTETVEGEFTEILGISPEEEGSESPAKTAERQEKSPYYLLVIHGPYLGKKYQLNFGETKIGRDSKLNDIVIRLNKKGQVDPSISRRHATVSYRDGGFYLTDKRSMSRTFVNQYKLADTDDIHLMPSDEIEIVSDQQSTIFRFVAEGNWDFSPPKQAGDWWLRYRHRALNVATLGVVIIGLIINFVTWRHRAIVTDVPDPFSVEFKTFTKIELDGGRSPDQSPRRQKVNPSAVLAEINGDGYGDIVVMQPSGILIAIDGKSRRRLWEADNLVLNHAYPPVAADLNDNDMADLVALTANGHLAAIDGLHGAEIWTTSFFESEIIGPPIVADFNGDNYSDVASISAEGKLHVGYSRVSDMEWVNVEIGLPCSAPLSAGDLDEDGDAEILIGTERGIMLVYDGVQRRLTAGVDINEELNKLKGNFNEDNQIRHPIGITDLNGDHRPDIVISSRQGNLLCLALANNPEQDSTFAHDLWWADLASRPQRADFQDSTSARTTGEFSYPFLLADLDNDGFSDVVALSDDGSLKAYRGRGTTGHRQPELWQTAPDSSMEMSVPTICDFNKDGATDIVIADNKRALKILSGKSGELLWRDDDSIAGPTGMPLLADLAGDTRLNIVLLAIDGVVYDFKTNRRVPDGSIVWGQKYGTPTNTSTCATNEPTAGHYDLVLLASSLVMGAAVFGRMVFHQRRQRFAKR